MRIERLDVSVYTIPTDGPEQDGTYDWDSTTVVLVEPVAEGGLRGLGYSYADTATATLVRDHLAGVVRGRDVQDVGGSWHAMVRSIRNLGRPGISSMAIAAVDTALWDLKARALDLPLFKLLGPYRDAIPLYGSGGFTSYTEARLVEQLAGWVAQGIPRVKMKIGRAPAADVARVRAVRRAIGDAAELFVDANGAYNEKQALRQAARFAESGVTWFEEPVSSDHLDRLRFIREHTPGIDVAAGEYGYDRFYFRRMLEAGAVDVIQADMTRCAGVTGWLQAAAIAHAFAVPLSSHCAPELHAQVACAAPEFRHAEYFYDHVRIAHLLFDGVPEPVDGCLHPDPSRPGFGLDLKRADAKRWLKEG
ncbi:MAG TPA: enolase C-terminal domain-like protein [Thermomicrobiales bacterium]|nr:enolase C-terminal domain-like protein [Thermomicrobiales bacterium]